MAPPPEVLAGTAAAWDAYDRLEAEGRRVHFAIDPLTDRLTVTLQDLDGAPLRAVSATEVLELACGRSCD